jgi:hypothetical protein
VLAALLGAPVAYIAAPAAQAESVPASVRACALETDSLKRLICFDREVAKYVDQPGGDSARDLRSQPTTPKVPPGPPREDRSDGGAGASASTAAPAAPAAAPAPLPAQKHFSGKILSIENFPDAIVVHLDNGQVWQQVAEASASVNLRPGDTVTIDREMAAYWLSGKDGVVVKVRQKK